MSVSTKKGMGHVHGTNSALEPKLRMRYKKEKIGYKGSRTPGLNYAKVALYH